MKKLHPNAFWLFFLETAFVIIIPIFFLILFIINQIFSSEKFNNTGDASYTIQESYFILLFFIFILVLLFIWNKLTYNYYKYELTDNGFRKESGVIIKKYTTIPYEKIQNVDIHRGILERILQISTLKIQTAGYSSYNSSSLINTEAEGLLPGVSHKEAEEIRDELIRRSNPSNKIL